MKKLINQNFSQKFYFYSLIALAFSIPIHNRLTSSIVVITGLFWLFEFNYAEKFRRIKNSKPRQYLMSFSILYLLFVIGVFYSDKIYGYDGGALFNLEKRMSILGFPLLLSTIDIENVKDKLFKYILKAFILGCLLTAFFLLNNAFFEYMKSNNTGAFYYTDFAEFHHPSYLAMYFSFAIAILLNCLLKVKNPNSAKRNAVFVTILFFQIIIILLSSKAGIIGMVIVYISSILYALFPGSGIRKIGLLIPLILLLTFVSTIYFNPNSYHRFFTVENVMKNENKDMTKEVDGSVARIFVWQSSLELIKEYPFFGVGTGDVKQKLMDKYEEKHITTAIEHELNAHNTYLQTFMALGIIGFLTLVISLIVPGWFAFRKKHLVYLLFLLLIAFHFMVESMLAKQAGVLFYAFFNAVLFYWAFSKSKDSSSIK